MQFTKIHQKLAKPVYEAIPKIAEKAGKKWEWKPIDTEWVLFRGQARILMDTPRSAHRDEYVPLLHWEDHLEPILEGMGWDLWTMERTVPSSDGTGSLVVVRLAKGHSLKCGRGKDRQEAFQRAILALVEGLG